MFFYLVKKRQLTCRIGVKFMKFCILLASGWRMLLGGLWAERLRSCNSRQDQITFGGCFPSLFLTSAKWRLIITLRGPLNLNSFKYSESSWNGNFCVYIIYKHLLINYLLTLLTNIKSRLLLAWVALYLRFVLLKLFGESRLLCSLDSNC